VPTTSLNLRAHLVLGVHIRLSSVHQLHRHLRQLVELQGGARGQVWPLPSPNCAAEEQPHSKRHVAQPCRHCMADSGLANQPANHPPTQLPSRPLPSHLLLCRRIRHHVSRHVSNIPAPPLAALGWPPAVPTQPLEPRRHAFTGLQQLGGCVLQASNLCGGEWASRLCCRFALQPLLDLAPHLVAHHLGCSSSRGLKGIQADGWLGARSISVAAPRRSPPWLQRLERTIGKILGADSNAAGVQLDLMQRERNSRAQRRSQRSSGGHQRALYVGLTAARQLVPTKVQPNAVLNMHSSTHLRPAAARRSAPAQQQCQPATQLT